MTRYTDGRLARAHSSQADAFLAKGNNTQAIAHYSEAIRLGANDKDIYFGRGLAFIKANDRRRGIADLDVAVRLDPRDALLYAVRGKTLAELGERERAIPDLREALRLNPSDADARWVLQQLGVRP